ncbi:MAG: TetR/AcrR family transcriptional regulator [Firmicutes bacterium]|nr:TetR/AcrR family transcriptional regulator [Bacillota bacterium]
MTCKVLMEKEVKQEKADKRELIMAAAMELFRDKGYSNTRIIDIAQKAGIGKGTVYAYFDSKEDLMIKLIREIVDTDFQKLIMTYGVGTTKDKILKYILDTDEMLEKYGIYATIFRDQIVLDGEVDSDEAVELVEGIIAGQYQKMRNILAEGIETGEVRTSDLDQATVYAMTAVGTRMMTKLSEMDKCGVPTFLKVGEFKGLSAEALVDFILNGIGA